MSDGKGLNRGKKWLWLAGAALVFGGLVWLAIAQTSREATGYVISDARLIDDTASAKLASVQAYRAEIEAVLQSGRPVMQIDNPSQEQQTALDILLSDSQLPDLAYDEEGNPFRIEVLRSYRLPAGQATGQFESCANSQCWRLDLYNFTRNRALVAVADLEGEKLLALDPADSQPDLPPQLVKLVTEIANNNSTVKKHIADNGLSKPLMAGTKSALEKTVCEKSRHLCVAPTYVEAGKQRALWVIVDLTDLKVVGTAWTKWDDKPEPLTERQLAAEAVVPLCGEVRRAQRGDWAFEYTLTGSDGLEVRNLTHRGQAVLASAKNVDWHVSYSSRDGFGYSDAVGCPEFSTAAVVPSGPPKLSDGPDGQVLFTIDFKGEKWPEPCNYYYRQQFQMNRDGSVRVAVANIGRGCGDDGIYRPVTRIALPPSASSFTRAGGGASSRPLDKEAWWQPTACSPQQACATMAYRLGGRGYEVVPGSGQFNDGGRGDNAYLYLTAASQSRMEGQQDLLTIGPCCNTDYQQGPEKFTNDEPLAGRPAVLWYVAQLENSGAEGQEYCWAKGRTAAGRYDISEYPCYSGPLIRLQAQPQEP